MYQQTQEHQQILEEERSRIMMEMHDGIGGQLVSMLSQIDNDTVSTDELKESIQVALDDLRLMVDSISPIDNDLTMALGMFRHRLEKTLAGSQMQLLWQVSDVDDEVDLGPNEVLHILRILQESTTNALKYSNGTQLTLKTGQTSDGIYVSLSDNGSGFDPACRKGQGLANMQRRANKAGIELDVASTHQGVTITLNIQRVSAPEPVNTAKLHKIVMAPPSLSARLLALANVQQLTRDYWHQALFIIGIYKRAYFPRFVRLFS